jgi:hypothetical protein
VDTVAVRELPELGAARETVCKHGRTFAGLAHRWQQFVFRHRDADLVMSPLGPEVSGSPGSHCGAILPPWRACSGTYAALGGEEDAALLQDDTRALNTAYRALAFSIQSMRRIQAGGQSQRAGATIVAATSARYYALNLVRDIPPAAVPDADTAALLNRGCQTLQASLISLQSALASPGTTSTRSASLFDLIEQRLAAPGKGSGDGHLALRDLRLIDGALA